MRKLLLYAIFMMAFAAHLTIGKRVLILPGPTTSHTKYLTNVARELVKKGHGVWLTMPDFMVAKGVLDTTNFTVIEYATLPDLEETRMSRFRDNHLQGQSQDLRPLFEMTIKYSDMLLSNASFFREVESLRPEFVVLDNLPFMKALTIIPYRLHIPFSFVGSVYEPVAQRVPFSPAVTPSPFFGFSQNMTFFQRVQNTLMVLYGLVWRGDPMVRKDAVARYAPEMPYLPIDMLAAKAEIWLVEMDHILDYPRPSLPNVKLIGGTATGPAKPLPPEFKSFVDGATEGVVIVSFGTFVLNLPKGISDKIFNILQGLPMKTIFRSSLPSPNPSKILTSTWIPQNDLLAHQNTKVFVSHCGKNGQYEALFHAVPVVATPLFADQFHNAERMRVKGMAETVDLRTVTEEELKSTILKVATDPRYKQAVSTASELFRIEFGVPMERAAFWLDHVMKYGGTYMRSAGQEMPYYKFLGVDVFGFIFAVLFFLVVLVGTCIFLVLKCLCRQKPKRD